MISEIIGGYLANSLAIICDAFHLLSDLGGFIISLFSTYLSTRKPSMRMNFGYRRIEVLGAFSSIIIIWLLTCALLYIAVMRIVDGDYEIEAKIMTTMAAIGVGFNLIMAFILSYTHSHKEIACQKRNSIFIPPKIIDSKQSLSMNRLSVGKIDDLNIFNQNQNTDFSFNNDHINAMVSRNINIRAAFIHIIGDIIQSFGVLIAALVIFFEPCWKIADPICTITFSIIVLVTTVPIVTDIIAILLESFPKQIDYDDLIKTVVSFDGVKYIYDLKCWYISADIYALNLLLILDPKYISGGEITCKKLTNLTENLKKILIQKFNFEYIFIQIDMPEFENSNRANFFFHDY